MASWLNEASALQIFGVAFAYLAGLTLLSNLIGLATERVLWRRGRKIFDVPLKRGQIRREVIGNVIFVAICAPILAGAIALGWLRFSDGWVASVVTFAVAMYSFQVFYYAFHRALHARALYRFHRWHHESLVTTPMTGFSMSPVEALGWCVGLVAPPIALSYVGLLGAWGWIAFLAFFFYGNVVGHSNAEIWNPPSKILRALAAITNPPFLYHSLHHARFDGHYGFANALMDRIFGTEWADWPALHARVVSGKALQSLRERGES